MNLDRRRSIHGIILVAVVSAVFANTLANGFVWDDTILLVGNRVYKEFDLRGMFLSLANGLEYLPLRDLSYAVDYRLWGEYAAGFHLTNLLLHAVNACLVYVLATDLLRMLDGRTGDDGATGGTAPLLAALCFAVHPLQCQAVNFVTCRNVLLSGMFFLLACVLYLRFLGSEGRRRGIAYGGVVLCCLGAFLAKATTIVLPLVLALLTVANRRNRTVRGVVPLLPLAALAAGFFVLFREIASRTAMIDDRFIIFERPGIGGKFIAAVQIPLFYLGKLALPTGFSAEYDTVLATTYGAPRVLAAIGLFAGACVLAYALRERFPVLGFALGWFVITLLPVMHLFPTNPVVADRYAYLPVVAVAVCLGAAVARIGAVRRLRFVTYAAFAAVLVWSGLAMVCNADWRSDITLWSNTIRTSPQQWKGYVNLAAAWFAAGDDARTLDVLAMGRTRVGLDDYSAYYQGMIHERQGDFPAAIADFQRALGRNPEMIESLFALASLCQRMGRHDEAALFFNKTILARGQDPRGYKAQARARLREVASILAPELEPLRRRVAEDPGNRAARTELALRLDRLGFYEEALAQYGEIVRTGVDRWELFYNMGNDCRLLARFPDAARYYEKSLMRNPGNPDALNNLGVAYREMKRYDKAIAAFQQALGLNAGFSFAAFNLGTTYFFMGEREKALACFARVEERFPDLAPRVLTYKLALRGR